MTDTKDNRRKDGRSDTQHGIVDPRDIQHGAYDPVSGVDMKYRVKDNASPHERAQRAADVRAESAPDQQEEFLPEALRRAPAPPLNKRTGRNRCE